MRLFKMKKAVPAFEVDRVAREHKPRLEARECNICGKPFAPHMLSERFCETCHKTEVYHYAEWLPQVG